MWYCVFTTQSQVPSVTACPLHPPLPPLPLSLWLSPCCCLCREVFSLLDPFAFLPSPQPHPPAPLAPLAPGSQQPVLLPVSLFPLGLAYFVH